MRISHVSIRNILGIEELEFAAGQFNVAEGHNGSGKTSVIEAIRSIVPGTEDATLLRKGTDKGEVVLLCDDGTEIKRRVGVGRGLTVTKDGVRETKAADAVKGLLDAISVNPVEFLSAKANKRVDVLLESLPMQVDPERLQQIAGAAAKSADPAAPALDQIAAVRKAVFDERTLTNRAKTEKEATINQLASTLPKGPNGATQAGLPEAEAELAKIDAARDSELARIISKLDGFREASQDKVDAIQKDIDAYQLLIEERRAAIGAERAAFIEVSAKANQQRQITLDRHRDSSAPIQAQVTMLKANVEAAATAEVTRKTLVEMRKQADVLSDTAARCTSEIDALDAYKGELLAALPIPGLEVRDGEVFRNEIPFDRLNKQQQVEIAVEIAKLRAGDLGIICVDDLELLDTEHFEAFRAKALESGLQLFVTRVADGPFAVTAA